MFHTYDHQLVYPSILPLSYYNPVVLFFQQCVGFIANVLPLQYFNDFYFLGTMVLLCGLFCMFQMFFSILDLVLADRDQVDTRIILMKKHIFELESEIHFLHLWNLKRTRRRFKIKKYVTENQDSFNTI
jgi:hypothetical protein